MKRLLQIPIRLPLSVVAAALGLTVFFSWCIVDFKTGEVHLVVDSSVDRLLPDEDDARAYFDQMSLKFGSRDSLVVALVMDDVFTPQGLATVARVSQRLEEMEVVDRVVSLATASNIRSHDGEIEIQPFLEHMPDSAEEIEGLRSDVFGNPLYAGRLVSRDARTSALIVYLKRISDQDFVDEEVDRALRSAAQEEAADGATVLITGPAVIKATTTRLIFSSLAVVLPISFLVMALIGAVAYRSLLGVLVPLASVTMAIVWTLGLLAWGGISLNLVTTIVPPLLLVIGFAYAVHVVSAYYEADRTDPKEVAEAGGPAAWALSHVALPVALTALTTIAGFCALTISPFPAVREFGWISVLGVALVVVISLTFAPAMFQRFGRPSSETAPAEGPESSIVDRLFRRLGTFDVRHRRAILMGAVGLALLSLLGMSRIEVNSDLVSNFRPDNPTRVSFEQINESLGGAIPISVVLESDSRNAFAQPENLLLIEELQRWLEEQPEVGGTTSVVDMVKVLNRALQDGDPEAFRIPNGSRLIQQLLLFGAGPELATLVDKRRQSANIQVRTNVEDTAGTGRLVERIEQRLEAMPNHLRPRVIGDTVLLARSMDDIAAGQIQTLSVAFVFIYAILLVVFMSFRIGFWALVPNVIPVLLYFGALGVFGVGLNTTTGLFACMILGIAVDDTIHLLTRFNAEARENVDEKTGAVNALMLLGRPVTITTVGLCLGFLALTSSEALKNQVEFGALGSLTLAFAWLVDITFTPALCSGMRVVTLWDALTYDLGESPQSSIPLLAGLSSFQARIAALLTGLVTFPAGSRPIRAGDAGDELYVVIEGELRVSIDSPRGRMELARAGRGDVIGEIALYYRGERTADVDAVTETRCLRLTKESLERLRRRYPRIGARIFWNLSEILAQRVVRVTQQLSAGSPAAEGSDTR